MSHSVEIALRMVQFASRESEVTPPPYTYIQFGRRNDHGDGHREFAPIVIVKQRRYLVGNTPACGYQLCTNRLNDWAVLGTNPRDRTESRLE